MSRFINFNYLSPTPAVDDLTFSNEPRENKKKQEKRRFPLPERLESDSNYTLEKPQKYFDDFIDNSESLPFIPKIQRKGSSGFSLFMSQTSDPVTSHPYYPEIKSLSLESFTH